MAKGTIVLRNELQVAVSVDDQKPKFTPRLYAYEIELLDIAVGKDIAPAEIISPKLEVLLDSG